MGRRFLNEKIWAKLVPEKDCDPNSLEAAERTRISGPVYGDDRDPGQSSRVQEYDHFGNNLSEF